MRFDVGFIFQVDTVFIAEVVPVWIIGIMRISYMIDIGAFHDHDLFCHSFATDGMTGFGRTLVPINAFQFHRFIVYIKITACQSEFIVFSFSVFDFHFAETNVCRYRFYCTTFFIHQFSYQHIAVGFFGRPGFNISVIQY